MAQILKKRELINTKLAKNNGGWIYCSSCNQTIGYLCYVTYNIVNFEYTCKCGNHGSLNLVSEEPQNPETASEKLVVISNRLCCPKDSAPLITILKQKLGHYSCHIVCKNCNKEFHEEGV